MDIVGKNALLGEMFSEFEMRENVQKRSKTSNLEAALHSTPLLFKTGNTTC